MAWRLKPPLITASDLLGRFLVQGGETVWVDGPLARAVRSDAIYYLDKVVQARLTGIHPYYITIDETAHDYLPHMYGAVSYTVLDDVTQLSYKVSDIYMRLTS